MSKLTIEDGDQMKEDIVFCVVVSLIRDKGGRRDSVSVEKLHMCWKHLVDRMAIAGLPSSWYQDPVTEMWQELDKAIQRLVFSGFVTRGRPFGPSTISLSLTLVDERKVLAGAWRVYTVILKLLPEFSELYDHTDTPIVIDGIREMPKRELKKKVSTPEA
jgi:hypothetical protein